MVSARDAALELFLDHEPLKDLPGFLKDFNLNLPQDIRAVEIIEVDANFNIIQHPKVKEYLYLFSFGQKSHPFAAPFLATFPENLDIALMKKGAKLFEGTHNFRNYCTKPTAGTKVEREVLFCEVTENTEITASFFPENSYAMTVRGSGFLRNQVRLMMGALVQLGRGEYSLEDIQNSLKKDNEMIMNYIAPGSGLILNNIDFF